MQQTQNFGNHTKLVPMFHFVVLPILFINLVSSIMHAVHSFSARSGIAVLTAVALLLLALYARTFALTVQDRVIRLEMQLRLQNLLPADLHPRIPEFTTSQLVALRFASDSELPDLARKVLAEKLSERKAIKQLIRDWQPDNLRA
ncbi:MAG TPA: DUF6526 family protein [Candidatus Acidoferrales bacterium]|jgi:hypothetical protein|nr:DUF6526 family protein [Candidatus Acidoferrales bacterium]